MWGLLGVSNMKMKIPPKILSFKYAYSICNNIISSSIIDRKWKNGNVDIMLLIANTSISLIEIGKITERRKYEFKKNKLEKPYKWVFK